jgi:hypothetical protein
MVFLIFLQSNSGLVTRVDYDRFLPDLFQFIVHLSSYLSTVHSLDNARVVKCEEKSSWFLWKEGTQQNMQCHDLEDHNTKWFISCVSIYGSTALADLGRFFSLLIYTQSVGLLGRGISPSQGRYLHTEQHKHIIHAHRHPCLERDSNP